MGTLSEAACPGGTCRSLRRNASSLEALLTRQGVVPVCHTPPGPAAPWSLLPGNLSVFQDQATLLPVFQQAPVP